MFRKIAVLFIPVAIIKAYRTIPDPVRSVWSMDSSSSGKALSMAVSTGNGWRAIARYANPVQAFENQSWDN